MFQTKLTDIFEVMLFKDIILFSVVKEMATGGVGAMLYERTSKRCRTPLSREVKAGDGEVAGGTGGLSFTQCQLQNATESNLLECTFSSHGWSKV